MKGKLIRALMFIFLLVELAYSQEDVEGSKDHPIISRYLGSYIYYKEKIEGKIVKIQYQVSKNRRPFEVFKNYEEN